MLGEQGCDIAGKLGQQLQHASVRNIREFQGSRAG